MEPDLRQHIRRCTSRAALDTCLGELDAATLSVADIAVIGRALTRLPADTAAVKIACLSGFNTDPLASCLEVFSAVGGQPLAVHSGEFNQFFQPLLEPSSDLHAFQPEFVFLAVSLAQLGRTLGESFDASTPAEREAAADALVEYLCDWVELACRRTKATVLLGNLVAPPTAMLTTHDAAMENGWYETVASINLQLAARLRGNPRVCIVNLDAIAAEIGRANTVDARLRLLARREWSERLAHAVARQVLRLVQAARTPRRKCLVLDLDNTLWGGVLGEDGVDGVLIGAGDPRGEAHATLQRRALGLRRQGIVLAVCSKNNASDVAEVFAKRQMPMQLDDFAAVLANWDNKADNLTRIAARLNIGTDSLVFLDDSAIECELVRQTLPEVLTVQVPDDPAGIATVFDTLTAFDSLRLTDADEARADQYTAQAAREEHREGATDLESFLYSLGIEVCIREVSAVDVARVTQLFGRTNQLNLTTIRYTESDVERFAASSSHELLCVSAADRFGALGTIGAALVEISGSTRRLDSFLLSCRAMGRGVETALMNEIKARALAAGCEVLSARYRPTAKNAPVADLCESQGFTPLREEDDGRYYELAAADIQPKDCGWIRFTQKDR